MELNVLAVTLTVSTLFVFAAAAAGGDDTGKLGSTTFSSVVIEDEGAQCPGPGTTAIIAEINQNVSTFLQNVVYNEQCGSTPENPRSSCGEVAEQKMNCPSGIYYIQNSTGSAIEVYCERGDVFPESLVVTEGWVRVANLNMTDSDQHCPASLQLYTDPVRACGKTTFAGCDSVTFSTFGIQYQHVCGRAIGYQFASPDAFVSNNIDSAYVDGISITHGFPRQHIWTYAAGVTEIPFSGPDTCPCTGVGAAPPNFVGSDYYCESGLPQEPWGTTVYSGDPLWDGQNCGGDEGTCCDPPNLPWFCKELPQPTTDDLEIRICVNENANEDILVNLFELYIQ